jgi:hypothetical protein
MEGGRPAHKFFLVGSELKLKIVNIRAGKGERAHLIYAELRDAVTNELLVNATLDYIVARVNEMLVAH